MLRKNPLYHGIYLGSGDGSSFEVINLDASATARSSLRASVSDRWVVIDITVDTLGNQRQYRYLNRALETRLSRSETPDFDVSSRPWYRSSMAAAGVHVTPP